jgi:phenylpyruvate tautomerase PptA (4-oxalocrotonate tautomerase family)
MPVIQVETRARLTGETKAELAADITGVVRDVIHSPMDLISVVFHDLAPDASYRSGTPTTETLIFCHIRSGRTESTIKSLLTRVSEAWSRISGDPETEIELVVAEYPARHTMRGGELLPEPPAV